jgi:hypothetical protein
MLINPTYGAGGAQSSGYVEDGLMCMADQGNNTQVIRKVTQYFSTININTTDGWSAEICLNFSEGAAGRIFKFDSIWVGCIQITATNSLFTITVFTSQSANSETITSEKFTFGQQHTIAVTNEGTSLGLYLDGELISMLESATFSQNTTAGNAGSDTSGFTLHNFRLYTRALTAAELAANHANDVAKYGGNS